MIELVIQKLVRAAESLQRRDFASALEALAAVDVTSLDEASQLKYYELFSESLWLSGDYVNALTAVENWTQRITDKRSSAFALAKRRQGEVLQQLGRPSEAAEAYSESYAHLRQLGDFEGAILPLDSLAAMHYLRGDYGAAARILGEEISLCVAHCLYDDLPRCRLNHVRVLVKMGDLLKSGLVLRAVVRDTSVERYHVGTTFLLGMLAVYKRQQTRAFTLLGTSLDYYERTGSGREVVICHEYCKRRSKSVPSGG